MTDENLRKILSCGLVQESKKHNAGERFYPKNYVGLYIHISPSVLFTLPVRTFLSFASTILCPYWFHIMLRNAASAHVEIEVFRSDDRTRAGTRAPLNPAIAACFSCR